MNIVLPLISTVVSVIFAITVLGQFASRRRSYQLIWGIGLILYGAGALTEVLAGIGIWGNAVYKIWYLCGAILTAAYLGMGTVYLLTPRRVAHVVMALLLLGSILSILMLSGASANLQLVTRTALSGAGMPQSVRLLTPFFNTFGSAALIGGAVYSAWVYWRKRIYPERVVSNVLIAVGAFCPVIGGSMLRLNLQDMLYVFEMLGIIIIFAGFMANSEVIASRFAIKTRPATAPTVQ